MVRLGARLGATFNEGRGQVYVHGSVNHDFMGDADATATSKWGAFGKDSYGLGWHVDELWVWRAV